jgi:hypothetical protein
MGLEPGGVETKMNNRIISVLLLILVFAVCSPVGAALRTYSVDFEASNFFPSAPTDPVKGAFTITFDPSKTYTNEYISISFSSLNIPVDSIIGFTYPFFGSAGLIVGGVQNGVDTITKGTNDFYLVIEDFLTTNPKFSLLTYITSQSADYIYSYNGNVSIKRLDKPKSLPSVLFLLLGAGPE